MSETISIEEQSAREAFSTMPATGPQWRALLWFLGEQKKVETAAALQAGLTNEARHYNAGRAAGVSDLIDSLQSAHAAVFDMKPK